ncbi:hypothetical protein ACFQ6E_20330 [Streptomyces sp. NPDC056462]
MNKPQWGYRCEGWAKDLDEQRRPALLASIDADWRRRPTDGLR